MIDCQVFATCVWPTPISRVYHIFIKTPHADQGNKMMRDYTQQTGDVEQMLVEYWASVVDGEPTLE